MTSSIIAHLRGSSGQKHPGADPTASDVSDITSQLRRHTIGFSPAPLSDNSRGLEEYYPRFGSIGAPGPMSAEQIPVEWMNNQTAFLKDLRRMLDEVELTEDRDIVSWGPRGLTFIVRNKVLFAAKVASKYFNIMSHSTFRLVIQTWGFVIDTDPVSGFEVYHHPNFIRDDPSRCQHLSSQEMHTLPALGHQASLQDALLLLDTKGERIDNGIAKFVARQQRRLSNGGGTAMRRPSAGGGVSPMANRRLSAGAGVSPLPPVMSRRLSAGGVVPVGRRMSAGAGYAPPSSVGRRMSAGAGYAPSAASRRMSAGAGYVPSSAVRRMSAGGAVSAHLASQRRSSAGAGYNSASGVGMSATMQLLKDKSHRRHSIGDPDDTSTREEHYKEARKMKTGISADFSILAQNGLMGRNFLDDIRDILDEAKPYNFEHIVSWMPHGRSFKIHKERDFVQCILPRYTSKTAFSSFSGALQRFGFRRVEKGPETGSFFHPFFIQQLPQLCKGKTSLQMKAGGWKQDTTPEFFMYDRDQPQEAQW